MNLIVIRLVDAVTVKQIIVILQTIKKTPDNFGTRIFRLEAFTNLFVVIELFTSISSVDAFFVTLRQMNIMTRKFDDDSFVVF